MKKIEPIFKTGTFGTHIAATSAGRFTFYGSVPAACSGNFESFDEAVDAFIEFFKSQSIDWQRENIGNLRNDVFVRVLSPR